jgi:release factor glutamine methyltransferase
VTAAPSAFDQPAVVLRLRAAGCVFAEDEARLLVEAAGTPAALAVLVDRRVAGEPLEHLLGWAEFCGLRVSVGPGVFVPRRRTGFLVRQAATLASRGSVVVDLCCGSGAVGMAVAAAVDGIELHAADVDPVAVAVARRNLGAAQVHVGDLFEALPAALRGRVDVLVANLPYVPSGSIALMPPEARDHEPRIALDGGPDGLDVVRRVTAGAPAWLAPAGSLLFESSTDQVPRAVEIVAAAGLESRVVSDDDLGATVVIGTLRRQYS